MERGEGLPVFELDNGLRLGILTCYDGWFPEPARALSLQGAEMIVWINGRGGSVEDFIVQATMFQSHVAMVTTNQACESDPLSGQPPRKPQEASPATDGSGTMIAGFDADGEGGAAGILARCEDQQEDYIVRTLDMAKTRSQRASSRNFAQRRPELYGALTDPSLVSGRGEG